MFMTADVIVDGALEESATFTDYLVFGEWLDGVKEDAAGDGYPTDVYVVEHNHALDVEECTCVQYLQDHRPYWSSEYHAPTLKVGPSGVRAECSCGWGGTPRYTDAQAYTDHAHHVEGDQ